jgi:hypothetical protein
VQTFLIPRKTPPHATICDFAQRNVRSAHQSGRPPTTLNGQIFDPRRPSKRPHPFREVHGRERETETGERFALKSPTWARPRLNDLWDRPGTGLCLLRPQP